jgi:WD40 repeat protein
MPETTHVQTHESREPRERAVSRQIVRASSQGLVVRSAALVARGLRDLARDSNWLIKKVFTGHASKLAISPSGQVCAISPQVRHGSQHVVLYDVELSVPTIALTAPASSVAASETSLENGAFAWSASARHLAAAWPGWQPSLHLFDLQGKLLLGTFGGFDKVPNSLAWSETGRFVAASTNDAKSASLRIWESSRAEMPFATRASTEIAAPTGMEPQAYGEGFEEEGAFRGYGRIAFSPDERLVAAVVEIQGEWADDLIFVASPLSLQNHHLIQAQGHVTDITWTPDSRQIVYCAAGQAYRLTAASPESQPLPFGAELCACHPHLPLCLCFSSWLKNSAKGRLCLVDLNRLSVFDEYPADGVVDLRWNLDGSKAFAMTQSGMAYIYEPPLV